MPNKSVFVSHISEETELAQWLQAQLIRDFLGMVDVFVSSDRPSIQAGSRWLDEVEKALKDADLQIVLCSRESVGRPWVNFEAGAAYLRGIRVVPACHSNMRPQHLPAPLSMLQGVVLAEEAGLKKLYDAVAEVLAVRVPDRDFVALGREASRLEMRYRDRADGVEVIENPRVLCAASAQYAQPKYGFDKDAALVERHFSGRTTVERALTSERLMDLLTTEHYDIIHMVVRVNPENGELCFPDLHDEVGSDTDVVSPRALRALLEESRTRLVVLATCNALLTAVEVAPVANMAASFTEIVDDIAVGWADRFYRLLVQGKSVWKAFDLANEQRETTIRTIRQKDVRFKLR